MQHLSECWSHPLPRKASSLPLQMLLTLDRLYFVVYWWIMFGELLYKCRLLLKEYTEQLISHPSLLSISFPLPAFPDDP